MEVSLESAGSVERGSVLGRLTEERGRSGSAEAGSCTAGVPFEECDRVGVMLSGVGGVFSASVGRLMTILLAAVRAEERGAVAFAVLELPD